MTDDIERLRAGIVASPIAVDLRYKLGCALEEAGRLDEASAAYREALALDPGFAKARNNLGGVLQMQGRPEEALGCFEDARRLDPRLWQPHYNIGNYHKLAGALDRALLPYQEAVRLKRAPGTSPPDSDPTFTMTSRSKLRHDMEQLEYLMARSAVSRDYGAVVAAYRQVLEALSGAFERQHTAVIPPELLASVSSAYNRMVNFYNAGELPGPAVNPELDCARIEAEYSRSGPGIVHVDDFLTPEALRELRRFCLESTIWFDFHHVGGYLGAYIEDGFICPLLAQITRELPRALPAIFGGNAITHLWGYKYDSELTGIGVHADSAAVNVNFWITPDEANLAPGSGGLVVWDREAPLDWDFGAYNQDVPRIEHFLKQSGANPVRVTYRQNRAVIFNSDLFHKTDALHFRSGYESRRVNITMLYGHRGG